MGPVACCLWNDHHETCKVTIRSKFQHHQQEPAWRHASADTGHLAWPTAWQLGQAWQQSTAKQTDLSPPAPAISSAASESARPPVATWQMASWTTSLTSTASWPASATPSHGACRHPTAAPRRSPQRCCPQDNPTSPSATRIPLAHHTSSG